MKTGKVLVWGVILLGGSLWAGEAAEGEKPAVPEGGAAEKKAGREGAKERMKEIVRKQKAGEELTAEEKELLENWRNRRAERGEGGKGQGGQEGRRALLGERGEVQRGPIQGLNEQVNPLDRAKFELAAIALTGQKQDEARKLLAEIAEKSPDEDAQGIAYYNLAALLKQEGKEEERKALLRKVRGTMEEVACRELIAAYLDHNAYRKALEELEGLLKATDDPLRQGKTLVAMFLVARRSGDEALMAEYYKKVTEILTYEQAMKIKKAAKERREETMRNLPLAAAWRQRLGQEEGLGFGPGGRRAAVDQLRKRIDEAEAAGNMEQAARLKRLLERMEQGGGPGEGRRQPGRGGRGQNPEAPPPPGKDAF